MKKIELLAPAGSFSKMKYAFSFGADAVYLGVPDFSLRVRINKFEENEIKEAVEYAHRLKKKVYVTLNIYAHNRHLSPIEKHLHFLKPLKVDAVIVSDPGIINLVKKHLPGVDIHLSTQANATNWQAVKFWKEVGVKRIILAREVTLEEIKEIRKKVPGVELEYFVHGAMCMSYSGRCILSKWMTGRSANLGDCAQPCRWGYKKLGNRNKETGGLNLRDDLGRYDMDVEEDSHGTYFFNSQDLNLIEYISDLIEAGVTSLKIEGRAKSAYYVAVVTRAYRKVIDVVENKSSKKETLKIIKEQKKELDNLTNRGYTNGFLLGREPGHNFLGKIEKGKFEFVGEAEGMRGNLNVVKIHNAVFLSDKIEAVMPEGKIKIKIKKILDDKMREVSEAHGGHKKKYYFEFNNVLPEKSLIRKSI
jgi:U32 family peptidase